MSLHYENDPYPPSLPRMASPESSLFGGTYTNQENTFFGDAYTSDMQNDFEDFEMENTFESSLKRRSISEGPNLLSAAAELESSQSPGSSPAGSSSNSSVQHQRHASTNSSRSQMSGIAPKVFDKAYAHVDGRELASHEVARAGSVPQNISSEFPKVSEKTPDNGDQQMRKWFDFDSAVSSPGASPLTETSSDDLIAGIKMPTADHSPIESPKPTLQTRAQNGIIDNRSAVSTPSSYKPGTYVESSPQPQSFNSNLSDFINTAAFSSLSPSNPVNNTPSGAASCHYPESGSTQPTKAFAPPMHELNGFNCLVGQSITPVLFVHPVPEKTRVETLIRTKLTISPIPQGITQLHLPRQTMARPKLISLPPPRKTPEMLELSVMAVCTSAMQNHGKMERALARARGLQLPHDSQNGDCRSPGTTDTLDEKRIKPSDGGAISICEGCVIRERKRSNRKQAKEPTEEERIWKEEEPNRIVVFNVPEIVDWVPIGASEEPKEKKAQGCKTRSIRDSAEDRKKKILHGIEPVILRPELAREVALDMRITCYCRHQDEKVGFSVIFTLKDYQGNCVAQALSESIMITDDHKTSALQMETKETISNSELRLPGEGVFAREPANVAQSTSQLPAFRQSHSTTDLLSSSFHPDVDLPLQRPRTFNLQDNIHQRMPRQPGSFTPSQNSSYRTSTTLTPRNGSRPVSPSGGSGPTPKRRKGSRSVVDHRPLVDLTMTRMQQSSTTKNEPRSRSTSPASSSGVSDGLAMSSSAFQAFHGAATNPTSDTSPFADHHFQRNLFAPTQNSLDETALFHPTSTQSSRPSRQGSVMAAHALELHHHLLSVPGAVVPPTQISQPMLSRVIPSEGPKSGGIEVTVLGEGFSSGLQVIFGNNMATSTTVLHSQTIVCVIPPSFTAGPVQVSFKGCRQPDPAIFFRYIDTDEQDLMKLALAVLHHRYTGKTAPISDIARSIIGSPIPLHQQQGHQHRGPDPGDMDIEASILKCLEHMDLAESSIPPWYNKRQINGQTMLHLAAALGYQRLVAGLLARGANPDIRDRNGMSPMHIACMNGHAKIVRRLLSAGGDPTLRTLLGVAPIEMATTEEVYQVISRVERHTRSKSAGATPTSYMSRASSRTSLKALWEVPPAQHGKGIASLADNDEMLDNDLIDPYQSNPITPPMSPVQMWARSRRNSSAAEPEYLPDESSSDSTGNTHMLAAATAMAAWRDNLAGQIQYFQQTMHRNMPNLQIPNVPPLPNFEAYQELPMVRRISSLVPRMSSPPVEKPPAYDDIYPGSTGALKPEDVKHESAARAVGDAIADQKCTVQFDHMEGIAEGPSSIVVAMGDLNTKEQPQELRLARPRQVKELSKDRKLFFVWIPILVLVAMALLKDWVPLVWQGGRRIYDACERFYAH